jgi:integrase
MAKELIGDVARGRDPQAERTTERGGATFESLHTRYLEEYAKQRNKSWKQAEAHIKRHVLPLWANLNAKEITRAQVKALIGKLSADRPVTANAVKAAISAVFTFGVKEEVLAINPCKGVDDNETTDRDRTLSAAEVPIFWDACEILNPVLAAALKVVLLTGQRPGEVKNMRREHLKGHWWEMPGKPVPELGWPGTKNAGSHRVYLTDEVLELLGDGNASFVFAKESGKAIDGIEGAMRKITEACKFDPKVTAHDLRRTMGTTITGRGHGREAMDRILNHREKSVGDIYDRYSYAREDELIMKDVCAHILRLVEGKAEGKVISFGKAK